MSIWKARIGLLVVAIIWAAGYIATYDAIKYISVQAMQTYRFGIGLILLCLIFHKRLAKINKRTIFYGTCLGLAFYLGMSVHNTALETTTVSKNAFLVVLNVVWVPIILKVFFKTKIEKHLIYGVIIMMIGFFILVFKIDFFNLSASIQSLKKETSLVFGDYLTLLAALIYAAHIVLIGYTSRKEDPINLVIIQLLVATVLSAIFSLLSKDPLFTLDTQTIINIAPSILFLGIFASIGFTGQIVFQKHVPSSNSAIIFSTESLFAVMFSVGLGYEPFNSSLLIGGVIITLGIVYAETGFKTN